MFSFFSLGRDKTPPIKRAAFAALAGLVLFFLAGSLIVSCDNPTGNTIPTLDTTPTPDSTPKPNPSFTVPAALRGTWVEPYSTYTITATTFSSGTSYGGYGGTIVNHRRDGSNAGYITIQYTVNDSDNDAIGKYYVIHYKNLTDLSVEISGAYNDDDPDFIYPKGGGKATQAQAEAAYTVGNGYFDYHSTIAKLVVSAETPAFLRGTWIGVPDPDDDDYDDPNYWEFEINEGTISLKYVMPDMDYSSSYFTATIDNVRENGAGLGTGYITLFYTVSQASANQNKYGILYWQNYQAGGETTVELVVAANSATGWGGSSKDTAEEAEDTYVWTPDAGEGGGYLVNNNGNKNARVVTFTKQ